MYASRKEILDSLKLLIDPIFLNWSLSNRKEIGARASKDLCDIFTSSFLPISSHSPNWLRRTRPLSPSRISGGSTWMRASRARCLPTLPPIPNWRTKMPRHQWDTTPLGTAFHRCTPRARTQGTTWEGICRHSALVRPWTVSWNSNEYRSILRVTIVV